MTAVKRYVAFSFQLTGQEAGKDNMRQYFKHYYNDFGNTYSLLYADTPEQLAAIPEGAERITRREAIQLAVAENQRRKDDAAFSG